MAVHIKKLYINNYRSIDSLTLENIPPFAVFAGPNGAGKSNFFKAMEFVRDIMRSDVAQAMSKHTGFHNIRSLKRTHEESSTFDFEIQVEYLNNTTSDQISNAIVETYSIGFRDLDRKPLIHSEIIRSPNHTIERTPKHQIEAIPPDKNYGGSTNISITPLNSNNSEDNKIGTVSYIRDDIPFLTTIPEDLSSLGPFLRNIKVHNVNPDKARSPTAAETNNTLLDRDAGNLAAVLSRLLESRETTWEFNDWLELFVPGLEEVKTVTQPLDGSTALHFKEREIERPLPAHLISDGTIHILALLAAVQEQSLGITLIEEPEHGIHPQAIMKLINYFREKAHQGNRPIWISTQSESVVRCCQPGELWLVDKIDGRTRIKQAPPLTPGGTTEMDEAWLCNVFGGGLPW